MKYILKQKPQVNNANLASLISTNLGVDIHIAQIIVNRNINSLEEAQAFLQPNVKQIHDPFLFEQMKDCVSTIKSVIASKGKICVYGDYDVDGTCGCAIMYLTLKQMGADVSYILPSRHEHGYGLSMETIKNISDFSLLITVDCGISNVEEIKYAKSLGIKTIITDHHECPMVLPKADYIINAKRKGETYPFAELCGAGVAFKLSCALIKEKAYEYIDIAALATVSDIVPILDENRAITKLGLEKLNTNPNVGVQALILKSGIKKPIDTTSISFGLAPRINSAGRIATALISLELLINKGDICELSDKLCELNAERQRRQEYIINSAISMYDEECEDRIIVLYKDDWDVGIVGLAASKLTELYNKPALLLGKSGDYYTGSARSISGVNVYEALGTQSNLYEKFGGHYGAAGVTIKEENIEKVAFRLNEYLKEKYLPEVFYFAKYFDIALPIKSITPKTILDSEKLKPFGYKNEQLEILIKNAEIKNKSGICENKHSKFVLKQGHCLLNGVVFGTTKEALPQRADVIGSVNINPYDTKPQIIVRCFSFEEITLFESTLTKLNNITKPNEEVKKIYFCSRAELNVLFVFIKDMAKNTFKNPKDFSAYIENKCADINKFAFAFTVFSQIGLLEFKKNGKIIIVVNDGKFELSNSATYARFQ